MIKSECCGARMVAGGIQCETCGSDGKLTRIKPIGWSQIQKEKRRKRRNKIIRYILIVIAIVIGMLIVMGTAGRTYPY